MKKQLGNVRQILRRVAASCAKMAGRMRWSQAKQRAWGGKNNKWLRTAAELDQRYRISRRIMAWSQSAYNEIRSSGLKTPMKSVGMKLFLTFFTGIIAFVLVVGMTSYQISKGVIQKKVAEASLQTITQAGQKQDYMYTTLEELSMQIILDKDLQDLISGLSLNNTGSYEYMEAERKLNDKLNVYIYANKSIKGIHLYQPDGKIITMLGAQGAGRQEGVASEVWFKSALENNGKPLWLGTRPKGYSETSPAFALARVIRSTYTNAVSGVLIMEIHADILGKDLAKIQLGDGSQVTVTDAQNKYIYSDQSEQLEKESSLKLGDKELKQESGSFNTQDANELVVFYKSKVTGWYLVGGMPVNLLVKDANTIFRLTWLMAGIAAVVAVVLGWFVARMIGQPLARLRDLMEHGARGNLTIRANFKSEDEIGQLGGSFDKMMQQITLLVQQTNQSAQEVMETAIELTNASKSTASAAREIAVATDEISGGATGLATESERGNDLTQSIGQQVQTVIAANLEMGAAATDVQSSSEKGTQYMNELIGKANLTEDMMRSMVQKVDRLKDSTSSIRQILNVLNAMTQQTNILSLNATIEAARAGAAGKGFMVVADEIRKLADQSKQSIDIVRQITDTIQEGIDETVAVLADASPIFEQQIQSVKEADTIFHQVTRHMSGFIEQLSEVSDSIQTLERSQTVLSDAMTNVSAVAEQSLATSEEVASLSAEQLSVSNGLVKLSDKLEKLSNSLKDSLSKFQV